MRQTAVDFFTSKRLSLEGVVAGPESPGERLPAFVACHPHPMLGGNMDNPVVTAVVRAADRDGLASLRFNFRGVGASQGTFSNGSEEQKDVKAGLEFLQVMPGIDRARLGLVGYSFGAAVVLNGLRRYKAARSLVLIAPPVSSVRQSRIRKDKRPKLFLVGQRDRVVPSADLQRALDDVRAPVQFAELPDADHSFSGREEEVAERVSEFLLQTLTA